MTSTSLTSGVDPAASHNHSTIRSRSNINATLSAHEPTDNDNDNDNDDITLLTITTPQSWHFQNPESDAKMGVPIGEKLKKAIIQPGMYHEPPFSLEVPGVKPVDGESIPRRNAKYMDRLLPQPIGLIHTLFDVLGYSEETYGSEPALCYRELINTHHGERQQGTVVKDGVETPVMKPWTYYTKSGYKHMSYAQYAQLAMDLGSGFRNLGLVPGNRIHIFAATSWYWLAISHGATTQSMPIVTSYTTLGELGLLTSLQQTSAKAIFVDVSLIPMLLNPLKEAKDIKFVIFHEDQEISDFALKIEAFKEVRQDVEFVSFEILRDTGRKNKVKEVVPKPQDLCCIMYTSGTTGAPKGVKLTHKNVVASIAGLDSIFKDYVGRNDSVLSYLPLAHSFEYAFENACLFWGMKMGYGSPKTLMDTSMKNCKGDIKEFRPTIMVGVPAVWDLVKKGIQDQVAKQGPIPRFIFPTAVGLKRWLCENYLPGGFLLDSLVFKSVRAQFGGRLRACFNGAGPLGKEDRRFISYTVAPLISGYGLTETTAMGALQDPMEWTDNTLGDIPASIEIKLVDWAEAGYFAKFNQGEIWIRGDAVMSGYYDNEEETQKVKTADGWFKTGDIGMWDKNGHLLILDRKKNLVKTKNGEYVPLEKLESVFRATSCVANICVQVSGLSDKIIAIVVPRSHIIEQFAARSELIDGSRPYAELLQQHVVKSFVREQLNLEAAKVKFSKTGYITDVILTDKEWTIDNDMLTPAQKLKRRNIYAEFDDEINEIFHPDPAKDRTKTGSNKVRDARL